MGSRSYPIWNEINSCLYKSMQSYGVKDHSEIDMNVGQGARHSHLLCTIKQTRREYGDWVSFCVFTYFVQSNKPGESTEIGYPFVYSLTTRK